MGKQFLHFNKCLFLVAVFVAISGNAYAQLTLANGQDRTEDLSLTANTTITVNSGTATISGVISGSFGIEKVGGGTNSMLVLSGTNTFTGGTKLSLGRINLANDAALSVWPAAGANPNGAVNGILYAGGTASTSIVVSGDENREVRNYFKLGERKTNDDANLETAKLTFNIASDRTLTISGVKNTAPGKIVGKGGAIGVNVPERSLLFSGNGNLILKNNTAASGGAIGVKFLAQNATLDFSTGLKSLVFDGNETNGNDTGDTESSGSGGAIYISGGTGNSTLKLGANTTFMNNKAIKGNTAAGGAIYIGGGTGTATMTSAAYTTFISNTAKIDGGAVYIGGGTGTKLSLKANTLFESNAAEDQHGGAIYAYNGIEVLGNTFFKGNSAGRQGGAIYLWGNETDAVTAILNTAAGHIAFEGNTSTTGSSSVFSRRNVTLTLQGNNHIYFDDPILTGGLNGGKSLVKTAGTGFVQFAGDSELNPSAYTGGEVRFNAGTFRIITGATFTTGGTDDKIFTLGNNATLAGGGKVTSKNGFTINGTLSPDADTFKIPTFVKKEDVLDGEDYNYFLDDQPMTVSDANKVGMLTLVGAVKLNAITLVVDKNDTSNDQIAIDGDLTFTGNHTIDLSFSNPGTYTLLTFTGTNNSTNAYMNSFASKFTVRLNGAALPGTISAEVTYETGKVILTIAKDIGDPSVVVDPAIADQTYTGSAITPTFVLKDGTTTLIKDTDYEITSYSDNIDAGTATITVTGKGGYSATKDITFTILKADPTINELEYDLSSKVYNKTARQVSVTAGNTISGLGAITILYDGNATNPVNAGTYAITVDIAEGTNYNSVSGLSIGNFTINPAEISVAPKEGQSKIYGESDPTFAYDITSGQLYGSDSFSGKLNRASGNNVGTYEIRQGTLGIADGNQGKNYNLTFVTGKLFTIKAASGNLLFDDVTKTYGDPDFELIATHDGGVPVKFESVTTDLIQVYLSQGTYMAKIRQAGSAIIRVYTEAGNYEAAEDYMIVTINRAAAVAPPSLPGLLEATYGDLFRSLTLPEGFRWPNPNSEVGNASSSPITVNAIYNPDWKNYEDYIVELQLLIHPAQPPATVSFPEADDNDLTNPLIYDPDQTLRGIDLINGSGAGRFTWRSLNTVPTVDNTGYEVVFTPADSYNYDYSGIEGWDSRTRTIIRIVQITILPRPIEVTLTGGEVVTYTGLPQQVSPAEVVVSPLRSTQAEIPALEYLYYRNTLLQDEAVSAGTYEVIARSANVNYSGQSATVDFTILKAQPVILINDTIAEYTGAAIALDYEITGSHTASGLSRTLNFIYEGVNGTSYGPTEEAPTEIGEYTVHISTPGSVNHLPAEAEISLKIALGVSIDQIASGAIRLYPNPVAKNSRLLLTIPEQTLTSDELSVEVYNTAGTLLRRIPVKSAQTELSSESTEGVYLYAVKEKSGVIETMKVVVK